MHIGINSVKKDEDTISPSGFALPHQESFIDILRSALLENPLLESIKKRIKREDLKSVRIEINVITEGGSLFLPQRIDFAGIDFVNYFDDKDRPVILQLHYGAYLGVLPHALRGIIKGAKRPEDHFQIRDDLSGHGLDPKGIKSILFHEFGHLIDALDPGFGYSNEAYRKIEQEKELFSLFEILWNSYLDRRLYNLLGEESPYLYGRTYLRGAEELTRFIWKDSKAYSFKDLIDHSLQFQRKNQKRLRVSEKDKTKNILCKTVSGVEI
jgi:hypothetical protein